MEDQLVATTRDVELRPLGIGGQPAMLAWHQLAGHLGRALGPEFAALFAEPNPNPGRGETEWYARVAGPAVPLASLPKVEQDAARAVFERLAASIRAEAVRLAASPRSDERFMGGLLQLALVVPGEAHVRVAAGQPVLVAWAHEATSRAGGGSLLVSDRQCAAAMAPASPAATAAPVPFPEARSVPPPRAVHAPPAGQGRKGAVALLGVLALAGLLVLLVALLPREPGKAPAQVGVPSLPEARWAAGDLGLLEGCWTLGAGARATYAAGEHREVCQVEAGRICFGADGKGTRESSMNCPTPGRVTCSAPIEARFSGDAIETLQPRVACEPGHIQWDASALSCRRVRDDLARCTGPNGAAYDFVAGRPSR